MILSNEVALFKFLEIWGWLCLFVTKLRFCDFYSFGGSQSCSDAIGLYRSLQNLNKKGFAKYMTKIAKYSTQFLKDEKTGFAKYTTKIAKNNQHA